MEVSTTFAALYALGWMLFGLLVIVRSRRRRLVRSARIPPRRIDGRDLTRLEVLAIRIQKANLPIVRVQDADPTALPPWPPDLVVRRDGNQSDSLITVETPTHVFAAGSGAWHWADTVIYEGLLNAEKHVLSNNEALRHVEALAHQHQRNQKTGERS